ncbi:MAG TPA: TerB family tellurite resistance protein [Candidatus Polarisedimenticolaceae bacterium]|nr:TerB family tellurite resistance protein [Candidatus Polarisedimenticolaceae bacterium]
MRSIRSFLGMAEERPAEAESDSVRAIVSQLEQLPPERARFVAAFGYILSRAARADLEIRDEEHRAMQALLVEHAGLSAPQAELVVELARLHNAMLGGTDNFLVTREFDRVATREQKLALLHCLFVVGAADGAVTAAEDHVIRRIADELHLEHRDFIAVRSRFLQHLAVLRPQQPPD